MNTYFKVTAHWTTVAKDIDAAIDHAKGLTVHEAELLEIHGVVESASITPTARIHAWVGTWKS